MEHQLNSVNKESLKTDLKIHYDYPPSPPEINGKYWHKDSI